MATETGITRTEHPHIVRKRGVCGGRPTIAGTRISVDLIARFLADGVTASQLLDTYPHLTPASVHDAISYYYDHKGEVDAYLAENTLERLAEKHNFTVDETGRVIYHDS